MGVQFTIHAVGSPDVIGQIGLFHRVPLERRADVGYLLRRASWGHGLGTESLRLVCRYGFRSMALHRITASVVAGNDASRRVLEHAGFRLEGTRRKSDLVAARWYDLWEFGLLRGELIDRGSG
jgi:RimJ/RimL family protein N-acetyltransferase